MRRSLFTRLEFSSDFYWLGYCLRGGSLTAAGDLHVVNCDRDFLLGFAEHMGLPPERVLDFPPTGGRRVWRVVVSDKHLPARLAEFGFRGTQSTNFVPSYIIGHAREAHFWRGVFDADGSCVQRAIRLVCPAVFVDGFVRFLGVADYTLRLRPNGVSVDVTYSRREQYLHIAERLYPEGCWPFMRAKGTVMRSSLRKWRKLKGAYRAAPLRMIPVSDRFGYALADYASKPPSAEVCAVFASKKS
jgi:hypothetical protein